MNASNFVRSVRDRLHRLFGYELLDDLFYIRSTGDLRHRLPPTAGCLNDGYNLFSVRVGHGGVWTVWKMDEHYAVVGNLGWVPSGLEEKYDYTEEDVDLLVSAIIRVNYVYLINPLMALVEGFESIQLEENFSLVSE